MSRESRTSPCHSTLSDTERWTLCFFGTENKAIPFLVLILKNIRNSDPCRRKWVLRGGVNDTNVHTAISESAALGRWNSVRNSVLWTRGNHLCMFPSRMLLTAETASAPIQDRQVFRTANDVCPLHSWQTKKCLQLQDVSTPRARIHKQTQILETERSISGNASSNCPVCKPCCAADHLQFRWVSAACSSEHSHTSASSFNVASCAIWFGRTDTNAMPHS